MKRTFLASRNALLPSSARFSWGALALSFAILTVLTRLLWPDAFWRAWAPAFQASDALSSVTTSFFSNFRNAAALSAKNSELIAENAALAAENRALHERLSAFEGLAGDAAPNGILAGVVARPPASPYDVLVVEVGSDAGVTQGMEAFGQGGVPLGIVSEVLRDFSRITLFSASHMATEAFVGASRIPLELYGGGAGTLRAAAPRSANIAVGDAVFAPGPGALPIGSVVRLDGDPSAPSVALQILPAVNPFAIDWVELRATGPAFINALSWATSTLP